jgi:hypothetical protein
VEDNFALEKRSLLEVFIREATQNPLDARRDDQTGPVEVKFRVLTGDEIDAAVLGELVDDEYISRLNASSATQTQFARPATPSVMVVEDFGTIGLQGTVDDPDQDGSGQNWNAFWFREGEGAKASTGSNGRAGQGKITYYRVSKVRSVFAYTRRASDGACLLMGRSSLKRNYALPPSPAKYERDAFWCIDQEELALPVREDEP